MHTPRKTAMHLPEVELKEDVIWRLSSGFARDIGQRLDILMPLTLYSLKTAKGINDISQHYYYYYTELLQRLKKII